MKEQLIKLLDLKTIITLIITIALVWGFFVGKIPAEQFLPFVTMIYMFYFQKKKDEPKID